MALLKIEDGTDHIIVTHDADNEMYTYLPKGGVVLKRNGDKFQFIGTGSSDIVIINFEYGRVDTSFPVHSSADTLDTALKAFIFS